MEEIELTQNASGHRLLDAWIEPTENLQIEVNNPTGEIPVIRKLSPPVSDSGAVRMMETIAILSNGIIEIIIDHAYNVHKIGKDKDLHISRIWDYGSIMTKGMGHSCFLLKVGELVDPLIVAHTNYIEKVPISREFFQAFINTGIFEYRETVRRIVKATFPSGTVFNHSPDIPEERIIKY